MLLIRRKNIDQSMICVHPKMHPSKIVEIENFRKFSISKFFIFDLKIFHFHTFFNENFENFWDKKIENFDLKNFHFHIIFNENFRKFSKFFRSQTISMGASLDGRRSSTNQYFSFGSKAFVQELYKVCSCHFSRSECQ